jgi:hypothetical protein
MAEQPQQLDSIDELLDIQEEETELQVTVERVPGKEDVVKVTPWLVSGVCLCDVALEIPKEAIDTVEVTGEKHNCCGKVLSVAQLKFHEPIWAEVLNQLTSRASATTTLAPSLFAAPAPAHTVFAGGPNCLQQLTICQEACARHGQRDPECDQRCMQAYQACAAMSASSTAAVGSARWLAGNMAGGFPPRRNCENWYQVCMGGCDDPDCQCTCLQGYQRCRGVPVMPC